MSDNQSYDKQASNHFEEAQKKLNILAIGIIAINSTAITLMFSRIDIFKESFGYLMIWFVSSIAFSGIVRLYPVCEDTWKIHIVRKRAESAVRHYFDEVDYYYEDRFDPEAGFREMGKILDSTHIIFIKQVVLTSLAVASFILFLVGIWSAGSSVKYMEQLPYPKQLFENIIEPIQIAQT